MFSIIYDLALCAFYRVWLFTHRYILLIFLHWLFGLGFVNKCNSLLPTTFIRGLFVFTPQKEPENRKHYKFWELLGLSYSYNENGNVE